MNPGEARLISAAIWGREHRNLTLGLLLTVSMAAFESLAVATALPVTVQEIGGIEWYGWAFSGFMLANLVSVITTGHAADRQGVARPFAIGSVLFIAGLVGAGLAPAMPVVVASRVAQGYGAGAIWSIAYVAIARAYPPDARPRMLAMLSSAWVVPGLIGPGLAGVIADHTSWRWVFLGLAPPTALASAMALPSLARLAPSSSADGASQAVTAVRLAAGTGAALYGLGSSNLVAALASLVVGAVVAIPALAQLLPRGTLRAAAGMPAAVAASGLMGFSFFAAEAFLPLSLNEVRGQSAIVSGITLTAATLTWTTGAWIQARLASTTSRQRIAAAGLVLIAVGVSGIAVPLLTSASVATAIVSWGTAGLGMGLAYTTVTLVVLESAPAGGEGASASATQLANVLGTALGTGVGGAIVGLATRLPTVSLAHGIVLVDLIALATALLGLLAVRKM